MEDTLASDPRVGQILQGRYRILARVASGGMGVVYRGERLELGRAVAIKFLHGWVAEDPNTQKRFRLEAQAMSQLSHPCCVSIIDFGVEGTAPFMVMDFITGETLGSRVHAGGPLPVKQALGIVRQVLAGLAHAHAKGIVHRDIKPDNIVLTEATGLGDQVRILDFGLARLRDTATNLTQGMPVGTPSYMAPEQIRGEEVDARTDIYSVGVLLFELLTGQKPFNAERAAAVMLQHQESPPPALGSLLPGAGFSQRLEELVGKAMAKKPEDRFQSAAEFAAALEALPEVVATPVPGPGPTPPALQPPDTGAPTVPASSGAQARARLGKGARMAVGAVGLLLVGGSALLLWPEARNEPPASRGQPVSAKPAAAPEPSASGGEKAAAGPARTVPPEQLPGIEQIERWVRAGRRDQALSALAQLRAKFPASAYAPYLEGQVNFDNLRWVDGLASYGAAIHNNPAYRSDPMLIRDLIRCLVSDRFHAQCEEFLVQEVGAPAATFLEEAARTDAYANVRTRAARLLPKVAQQP
jgi:eukaryotic-like serine/threonine-protein kinase